MADIEKLDKKDLVKLAKNMRNRARNFQLDKQRMGERLTRIAVGSGAAFGVGYLLGDREARGEDNTLGGYLDLDLAIGFGLAVAGALGFAGKKGSDLLEGAGAGVLAGWSYTQGHEMGKTG